MSPTRVGLVGCGRWGSLILRDLVSIGCQVSVVARSKASIDRAAAGGAFSIHPSITDLSLLVKKHGVSGFVVATQANWHFPVVMEIAQIYGSAFPIFCEKPLATSVRDAETMALACERLYVMDKWRYHPAVRRIQHARATGEFGPLLGLRTSRFDSENRHPDVSPAWTYMPHELAIVLEVMGYVPHVMQAYSASGDATVLATLGHGRPWALLECSTTASQKARSLTAFFERAVLSMTDPLAPSIFCQEHGKPPCQLDAMGEMPLLAELRAFVGYLEGGLRPLSPASDGITIVRKIEEILDLAHAS